MLQDTLASSSRGDGIAHFVPGIGRVQVAIETRWWWRLWAQVVAYCGTAVAGAWLDAPCTVDWQATSRRFVTAALIVASLALLPNLLSARR